MRVTFTRIDVEAEAAEARSAIQTVLQMAGFPAIAPVLSEEGALRPALPPAGGGNGRRARQPRRGGRRSHSPELPPAEASAAAKKPAYVPRPGSIADIILKLVAKGPAGRRQIAAAVDSEKTTTEATVDAILGDLRRRGVIRLNAAGQWEEVAR